jgi:4-azaleucine resistance transporter AzlC
METTAVSTPRSEFLAGMRVTLPLVVGAIPFGTIFGALAVAGGLSPAMAAGMSAFVFAGSAQFIAVGLLTGGASAGVVIFTTLIVNLRHALYSVTLAPHVARLGQRWLIPLGFWLTDETFVLVANRYNQPDRSPHKHWFYLGSAVLMYVNWQLSTWVGIVAGGAIPDPRSWGLDFAMVVTFTGMIVPMIVSRAALAAVTAASLTAIAFYHLPNQTGLMIAAVCGVAAGMVTETWVKRARMA